MLIPCRKKYPSIPIQFEMREICTKCVIIKYYVALCYRSLENIIFYTMLSRTRAQKKIRIRCARATIRSKSRVHTIRHHFHRNHGGFLISVMTTTTTLHDACTWIYIYLLSQINRTEMRVRVKLNSLQNFAYRGRIHNNYSRSLWISAYHMLPQHTKLECAYNLHTHRLHAYAPNMCDDEI